MQFLEQEEKMAGLDSGSADRSRYAKRSKWVVDEVKVGENVQVNGRDEEARGVIRVVLSGQPTGKANAFPIKSMSKQQTRRTKGYVQIAEVLLG